MNKVILSGRIIKDPEVRYTQNGIPSVNFSVAVDRGTKDQTGNRISDFINCVAWRNTAEFMANYIKKGYLLLVEGKIQTRTYQAMDNTTRYVTEVICDNIEILSRPQQQAQQSSFNNNFSNNRNINNYQMPSYTSKENDIPSSDYMDDDYQPIELDDDDLPF